MKMIEAQGARIPALGFGTWRLEGKNAQQMVEMALGVGYRHIDTAEMYGNEEAVGQAIRNSGIPRDQIFLTTKIWPDHFSEDEFPGAVDASLERLGVDYVDLLLLHWPNPAVPLEETVGALNSIQQIGKTRYIGVSNFTIGILDNILSLTAVPLVTNQVEYHPFLVQAALLDEVRDYGMSLTAYSPLAKGRVVNNGTVQEIAQAHGKSPAQIALRWLVQQPDVAAIPKASSREHLEENFNIWDFELSAAEMKTLFALNEQNDRLVNPARLAPDWGWPRETEDEEEPKA